MTSSSSRVFAAVAVPPDVREAVHAAAASLRAEAPELRWTDPGDWHLTVAFVGSVPDVQVQQIAEACAAVASRSGPLPLRLTGHAGTFGGRVLWAGLHDAPALERIACDLGGALRSAGFAVEDRPFRAHLTLARARRGAKIPPGLAGAYAGPVLRWTVRSLELLATRARSAAGSRYERLGTWALGEAAT